MAINGTVTTFNSARGFGFIKTDSAESFFFHISQWPQGEEPPRKDQRVAFDVGSNGDGRERAENVTPLRA